AAGDLVFFEAWDGLSPFTSTDDLPRSLWRSDGTDAGTFPLTDASPSSSYTPGGRSIYFMKGQELWTSDGTVAGTGRANELLGRFPRPVLGFTIAGDRIFVQVAADFGSTLRMTSLSPASPAVQLSTSSASGVTDIGGG